MFTEKQSAEKLTGLYGNVSVITTKEHGFGHDAVLLSYFARAKNGWRICDFGTGCGIIPLLLCRYASGLLIDAVELQHPAAENAARSAALSGLSDTVHILEGDYFTLKDLPENGYDLITCNPPYGKPGCGAQSGSEALRIARQESKSGLPELIKRAYALLKNGGRLCLCHRPERLAELIRAMQAGGLEPKRLRFAQHRPDKKPWLVLCEGRKNAAPGLDAGPVLLLNNLDGSLSDEMRAVYDGCCVEKPAALGG